MTTYRFAHSPRPPPVAGKMSNTAKAVRSIARKESTMKLILCDTNERLCAAWKHRFAGEPDVEVIYSRFEDVTEYDAIVSPGNSFGLMDGGIDAACRKSWQRLSCIWLGGTLCIHGLLTGKML